MIKGESARRWKLANPSLLLRSHYDYKERGKSALWVSAAIWCIHLAAHPTWEMSLYGWIYLSHWLGLRWINCLGGGIEMEAVWHRVNSHFEFNARTWGRAHQIKSGGKADLVDLLHRDAGSDMAIETGVHSYGRDTISILSYGSDFKGITCSSFDSCGNTFFLIFKEQIIAVRMWASVKYIYLRRKIRRNFKCLKLWVCKEDVSSKKPLDHWKRKKKKNTLDFNDMNLSLQ